MGVYGLSLTDSLVKAAQIAPYIPNFNLIRGPINQNKRKHHEFLLNFVSFHMLECFRILSSFDEIRHLPLTLTSLYS